MTLHIAQWRFSAQQLTVLCLLILSIVSIVTIKDYGISWDEPAQWLIVEQNWNFIQGNNPDFAKFHDRDYGVLFELPVYAIAKWAHIDSFRNQMLLRHGCIHVLFLFASFVFFKFNTRLFKNEWLGFIAFILLVFQPIIYGHSFFNSKDIPLLCAVIFLLYQAQKSFQFKTVVSFFWLGLFIGLTTALRIIGVVYLPIALVLCIIPLFMNGINKASLIFTGKIITLLLLGWMSTTLAFWPALWADPFQNFIQFFQNMSLFRWEGKLLFEGREIKPTELPWYYASWYIAITTPILVVLFSIVGVVMAIPNILKDWIQAKKSDSILLAFVLAGFIGPLLAVIILKSVLYDGWRQLYYVYPGIAIMATYAIYLIWKMRAIRNFALVLLGTQFVFIIGFMIKNHPYQHVYFNELVSRKPQFIRYNYEMDYWGCSSKAGIEYILKTDERDSIYIKYNLLPQEINVMFLQPTTNKKLIMTDDIEIAQYYMGNYRNHPSEYNIGTKVFSLEVLNSSIVEVRKLR